MTSVAWIYLNTPDEVVEGHYWTPSVDDLVSSESDVRCPFCSGPTMLVSGPYFGRIMQERIGTRTPTKTLAVVDVMPKDLEAVSCEPCDLIFTRPKDVNA